ncbi:MAG: HPP family protein [Hyphomicrobiales bacterium]
MNRFLFRHQPPMHLRSIAMAGLGGALAIVALSALAALTGYAWLMAPFGASAVLLFAAPTAVLSQPINVVAGHLVAALIGVVLVMVVPGYSWGAALAVGLAISSTAALRIIHPPAGATALFAYLTGAGWTFVLVPALTGSMMLVAIACVWQKLQGGTYPINPAQF